MSDTQIKQTIGQIEASINKIESLINNEDYKDYCDHAYSLVTYWKTVLKTRKNLEEFDSNKQL